MRRLRSQDYCVASPQILTPRGSWAWISLWDLTICGNQTQGALKVGSPRYRPNKRAEEQCGGRHFLPSRRELSHVAERNQEGESPREPSPGSSLPFISTVSVQPALRVPCTAVLLQANFRNPNLLLCSLAQVKIGCASIFYSVLRESKRHITKESLPFYPKTDFY